MPLSDIEIKINTYNVEHKHTVCVCVRGRLNVGILQSRTVASFVVAAAASAIPQGWCPREGRDEPINTYVNQVAISDNEVELLGSFSPKKDIVFDFN